MISSAVQIFGIGTSLITRKKRQINFGLKYEKNCKYYYALDYLCILACTDNRAHIADMVLIILRTIAEEKNIENLISKFPKILFENRTSFFCRRRQNHSTDVRMIVTNYYSTVNIEVEVGSSIRATNRLTDSWKYLHYFEISSSD